MPTPNPHEVSRLLLAWSEGDKAAMDQLIPPLDEALRSLAEFDARKSQVVELRFFGGLSVEETAEALDDSVETVHRDWRLTRSWLLRGGKPDEA